MSEIIDALKKAVELNPDDWESRLSLIRACLKEGDRNGAVEALNGIEKLPTDSPSLIAAAKCYAAVGSPGASQVIEPLVEAEPENAQAHLTLAQISQQFGDSAKARKHYYEACKLDSSIDDPALTGLFGREEENAPEPAFVATPDVDINDTGAVAMTADPIHTAKIVIPPQTANLAELREQERLSELKSQRTRRREQIQALFITIVAYAGLIFLLSTVVLNVAQPQPPEIVASAAVRSDEDTIEKKTMTEPQPWKPPAASSALTEVITTAATSNVAMPSFNENAPTDLISIGQASTPSMSFALPGEETKMLFGQKVEGKVLGVVLDVSGSMAEYLPKVIREIDKEFEKSPIVFVNHTYLRGLNDGTTEIWPIVAEDVVPRKNNQITPYWFLWGDLPRKADQEAVNRLIEIFKTRPNCYLAVGGGNRIATAVDFLVDQKIDALYLFSDFEDYTDEEVAAEVGKKLLRAKVKTYVQPAEKETEYLNVMGVRVVNRSQGRKLPPLVAVASRSTQEMEAKAREKKVSDVVNYATPRTEKDTGEFYSREVTGNKNFNVIGSYQHKLFDAVVYGPEARIHIYLKDDEGRYIQRPLAFYYWSGKYEKNERYGNFRTVRRKFLRAREEPKFENNTVTWLMEMESGDYGEEPLEFDIELTIDDNRLVATYVAELLEEESKDVHPASIYFRMPRMGYERNDLYYAPDFTEGLNLDQVREAVKVNKAVFNLPGANEDRYGTTWAQSGFKRGMNEFTFDQLIRREPPGVRDITITGPSFGPRKIEIGANNNRLLISGEFYRNDIELWEGFGGRLTRPADRRERWTKTEAFRLQIE